MNDLLTAFAGVDPIAFSVGPFSVHWYGLAYITGILAGVGLGYYFARRWGLAVSTDDLLTIALCVTVGIIVGGRLGYVLFYGGTQYWTAPSRVFAIYDGGMSFHGGFLGCVVGGYVASRLVKVPFLTLLDLGGLAAPIGLFLGRISNFINGEVWGRTTDASWGVVFSGAGELARHPSQLYEAFLEGIVLLAIMVLLARRVPSLRKGVMFSWFLILYGIFRVSAELFREPDRSLGFLVGDWLTMGMLLSIPMVLAGIALLKWSTRDVT